MLIFFNSPTQLGYWEMENTQTPLFPAPISLQLTVLFYVFSRSTRRMIRTFTPFNDKWIGLYPFPTCVALLKVRLIYLYEIPCPSFGFVVFSKYSLASCPNSLENSWKSIQLKMQVIPVINIRISYVSFIHFGRPFSSKLFGIST